MASDAYLCARWAASCTSGEGCRCVRKRELIAKISRIWSRLIDMFRSYVSNGAPLAFTE